MIIKHVRSHACFIFLAAVFVPGAGAFPGSPLIFAETSEQLENSPQKQTIPRDYEQQERIVHSATGRSIIVAVKEGKKFVFAGNRRMGPYDAVRMASFSKDGKSFAYSATTKGSDYCIVDGKRSNPYSTVCNPTFSEDGRLIAFEASHDGRYFVAFGDAMNLLELRESPRYDMSTMQPAFSRDGTFLFYSLDDYSSGNVLRFITDTRTGKHSIRRYDMLGHFQKSPDGRWYAHMAGRGGRYFLIIGTFGSTGSDEREGPYYDLVSNILISPDGNRLAYTATKNERQFVVVSDRTATSLYQGTPHDRIDNVRFLDSGNRIFFTSKDGSVIMDKLESFHDK